MKKYVADWVLVREAENAGLIASMTNIIERNRTELTIKLSSYFREKMPNYKCSFDEDESEDILYSLNEYITEHKIDKRELDFPFTEGTDIHLLKVTDNLAIKIVIADEYYGGGDYSKYIEIGHFVINEYTTEKDVDDLIEFVRTYLMYE